VLAKVALVAEQTNGDIDKASSALSESERA
jgi:NACalpha-BTF3-like transcription factor